MVDLILEKGYDAVSVSEITDRAELGRATFYLHYKDKDDLLIETINDIVQDFIDKIADLQDMTIDQGEEAIIRDVFLFTKEHPNLFRVIMRGHGMYTATLKLQSVIAEFIYNHVQKWIASQHLQVKIPLDILSNFYAGAMLNSIFWWLENDTGYSAEEMAENYNKLVFMERDILLGRK
jgi:AcrR family transcriptional regulator